MIALSTGSRVAVQFVNPLPVYADAVDLVPLPMRYHGNEVPR